MAFFKATTSLAALEQKLRRQLGLAGEIGASFKPEMIPVMIAGDLREPGNSDGFNSRSWGWALNSAFGGANLNFSIRFDAPVLITEIYADVVTLAHTLGMYVTPPGQAPAVAVAEFAGTYVDNKQSATDQVPILQSAGGLFVPATGTAMSATNRFLTWQSAAQHSGRVSRMQLMLPVGSHLNWQGAGTGAQVAIGMSGRIWP